MGTAFVHPMVDRSLEPFAWGSVDRDGVVRRLTSCTGLAEEKIVERLEPALRRYEDGMRQPRITEYMVPRDASDVAMVRSGRMRNALQGLRGEESDESQPDDSVVENSTRRGGRKRRGGPPGSTAGASERAPRRRKVQSAEHDPDDPVPQLPVKWALQPTSVRIDLDDDDDS